MEPDPAEDDPTIELCPEVSIEDLPPEILENIFSYLQPGKVELYTICSISLDFNQRSVTEMAG